jgi:hypothetical protein
MKKILLLLTLISLTILGYSQKVVVAKEGVKFGSTVISASEGATLDNNTVNIATRFADTPTLSGASELDAVITTPYTGGVVETKTRTANQAGTFAGTVRNVPGSYATISAAYTAAANGDIIQLADGTYNLSAESGGYFMPNTTAKGVLVRGNASNRSAVILNHTGSSYGIRLRDCAAMMFQDLTITSNGTFIPFLQEQAYASRWVKVKNCALIYTGSSAVGLFQRTSLTSDTNVIWIEFDGCSFTSSGTITPIQYGASGINETILVTNCTFTVTGLTGTNFVFDFKSDHKGLCAVYDCTMTNSTDAYMCQFGTDEAVPTNTTFKVDFRNNTLLYTGAHFGHGILLGRGTNKVYCVNNTVTIPSTSNSLAIGMVIKTAATAVNDCYIAGNYIVAPRPYLIKGGQNNILKFNTGVTNYPTTYFGLEVSNPEASRLSSGNVIRFNNFYGGLAAIGTYDSSGYEDPETSMKGWTMNNNRYFATAGVSNWANVSSVNKAFSLARSIFDNNNDCYSKFAATNYVTIATAQNYDATSTISW